jgi:ABC-type glycerol-3-phosphate transport system substrate-binding protein
MKTRKLLPLLVLLALVVSTLAPVAAQDDEPVTLTWLTLEWDNADMDKVIGAFEEANPDIHIELEQVSFNDLFQQIQVRLGAGTPNPDLISVDGPLVAAYSYRGWLLPLDEYFTEEEKEDWLPSSLMAAQYDGQLTSAPVSTSTQLLIYNADVFEEAGVTPPGPDDRLTWEEIAELAPQLTLDRDDDGITDVWGFTWEQVNRIYQLQPLPMSLGGQPIGDDGLTVQGIINGPEWVDAFTYYYDMFNTLQAAPQGDYADQNADLFFNGNIAMMVGGTWNINRALNSEMDFDWGVSRHPYFADGEVVTPTGSWHIGANAATEHPEEAARFIHWLTTSEGAETWWRDGSGDFPAQQSVLALFQTEPEFQEGMAQTLKTAADEATVNPQSRPVTVGYLEYEQILQNAFLDIINGADVQESLDIAASRIESEMSKYQ